MGYNKAWARLSQVVHGNVSSQHMSSTLRGDYHGHPVLAMIRRGGQDTLDVFSVEIPAGPGGRGWEIAYRSEQLLGRETWRVSTKDPALQSKLDAAGVATRFRDWPEHTSVHYDAAQGVLVLREEIFAPSSEHFKAQLDLLESLAEMNRRLNAGRG